jgi:hypothetical protein
MENLPLPLIAMVTHGEYSPSPQCIGHTWKNMPLPLNVLVRRGVYPPSFHCIGNTWSIFPFLSLYVSHMEYIPLLLIALVTQGEHSSSSNCIGHTWSIFPFFSLHWSPKENIRLLLILLVTHGEYSPSSYCIGHTWRIFPLTHCIGHIWSIIIIIINVLMPVKQNSYTHLRDLLILFDCGHLAQSIKRRWWAELSFAWSIFPFLSLYWSHLKELINRYHLTLTKWVARKLLRRVVCGCMPLTSGPPERSPTAHWAKRAYTYHHHSMTC